MVRRYLDSSALLALYVTEEFSGTARREAARSPSLPFTMLHDVEVRSAVHALAGRKLLSPTERDRVLADIEDDLRARRLSRSALDLALVFERARDLVTRHTESILCRTLDVLHVAAARELGCTTLVSGDDRQLKLAVAIGMTSIDIKRSRQPARRRARSR